MTGARYEIASIYENSWPKLTERYFKEEPWPRAEDVSHLVAGDQQFLTLYKELYYRHIYDKLNPTLEQRFESYENYYALFNDIVHGVEEVPGSDERVPIELELPNRWLWDIIDEFIYQFESFSQYSSKMSNKSENDIIELRKQSDKWNPYIVLNVLHSLIDKSNINEQLEAVQRGEDPAIVGGEFGNRHIYKMLGYFSLIGLLRLQCLLGDYHQALSVITNIELGKQGLYASVPACQITVYYYIGFCYLMIGRYQDATRTFENALVFIQRTQSNQKQGEQQGYNVVTKKASQLYNVLAIAMTLSPQRIDENVHQNLLEKVGEKMIRMRDGDMTAFEELFQFGCPKFLSPSKTLGSNPYRLQLKVFVQQIQQ